jgi:hypothetical protein
MSAEAPVPTQPSEKQSAAGNPSKERHDGSNGIAAAVARSLTRGVAIYFSRPVRLFRPSKGLHSYIHDLSNFNVELIVSGWTSLRGSANRDGAALSPSYVLELIRSQGVSIHPFYEISF